MPNKEFPKSLKKLVVYSSCQQARDHKKQEDCQNCARIGYESSMALFRDSG